MVFNLDVLDRFQQTRDTISLLESLPYIEREFVDPTPSSIPLMELEDHPDVHFVRYSDLEHLAEVRDIPIHEAADSIQKANLLPSKRFVVAMEEWRPLLNPSIIDEFPNVLLIKEVNTPTYLACEACMNMFMETQDMIYVDLFLEADNATMTQYHLKAERLQSQIAAATEEIKKMRQNDPNYANANKRLMGMQDALEKTQRMMAELEKSGSKSTADPNASQVADARKAGEVKGKEFAAKAANGFQNPAKQQAQATGNSGGQEQQSWWARKWTSFKNWMNNLGSNGDQKSTWFTNMIDKVKAKFNGNAQATNQQSAQPSQTPNQQQGQSAKPQGTAVEQITNQVAQKGTTKAGEVIDSLKGKVDQVVGDALGIDVSGITKGYADNAKEFVNNNGDKIASQAADLAQKGINAATTSVKQTTGKVKNAVKGAVSEGGGRTTVTKREVSEDEVPTWAKNKIG